MRTTPLLFAAAAGAATTTTTQTTAANLTTTVFANYYVNFGAPIASVIAADPTGAATYHIRCDAGAGDDPLYCNLPSQGITVTAGPSTWAWSQPMKPESGTVPTASFAFACRIEGTTRAVCTRPNVFERWYSVTRLSRTDLATAMVVETVAEGEMDRMWGPVTVTAGAEKLLVAAAAAAAAASGSEATATTTTAAVETAAAAATSSTSGTRSSSSSSSSAVASRTTDTRISEASSTGSASAAAASSTNGAARFGFSFAAGAAALLVGPMAL